MFINKKDIHQFFRKMGLPIAFFFYIQTSIYTQSRSTMDNLKRYINTLFSSTCELKSKLTTILLYTEDMDLSEREKKDIFEISQKVKEKSNEIIELEKQYYKILNKQNLNADFLESLDLKGHR